ncbi:hypothetical protein SAMN05443428_10379 [Caloramator quimbayensis]|uniref:Methyltransferase domain-containing protein n=1 Tax=Caloramator quimbayensis TaxID=1147123 RepID=A0A1T4WQ66_9CLOT|nr:hypothetical protein [Caloramator quimbayensis]SKA79510.1 hypothetical protein SAMN05443428_10379 [Caloramator quimbayensis]
MPTSYYGQISTILDIALSQNPKSILDVGIGFGKYGVLLREILDISNERYSKDKWEVIIDGIEGYKDYKNPIYEYVYNKVYFGFVQEVIKSLKYSYDLILMIDVLEHFNKNEGEEIIESLLQICKNLLVCTPAIPSKQTYLDNNLEEHKSLWKISDFKKYKVKKVEILPMTAFNSSIILLLEGRLNNDRL